jgi:hypothetical protein
MELIDFFLRVKSKEPGAKNLIAFCSLPFLDSCILTLDS